MDKNAIRFEGYIDGVLTAMYFEQRFHGNDSIVEEMRKELLNGIPRTKLQRMARKNNMKIDWRKIRERKS